MIAMVQKVIFYTIVFSVVVLGYIFYAVFVENVPVLSSVLAGIGSIVITILVIVLLLIILERRSSTKAD